MNLRIIIIIILLGKDILSFVSDLIISVTILVEHLIGFCNEVRFGKS